MEALNRPYDNPGSTAPARAVQDNIAQVNNRRASVSSAASAPNTVTLNKPLRKKRAPYYPTGDGKPMAEDVLHVALMNYVIPALMYRYRLRPDVHVAGNDFLYYEEGNPKARISPDCYVTFGVEPKTIRHFYKVWEENNVAPSVVFEFTSKKTRKEDVTIKRPLYEQVLRVAEYFQFDPTGDYLRPRLQGQRLINGVYQPIELNNDRMTSEQLGLEFIIEDETLRLYDPVAGAYLPTYHQAETLRQAQTQRAEAQTQRAEEEGQRAEAEAQRAEQEAQRAEQEAQRAETADQRAQAADRRAEVEVRRAETAEAELNRLRNELDALRQQK